jgi:hypothetical protein
VGIAIDGHGHVMDAGMAGPTNGIEVMEISRSCDVDNIADLGLALAEAKQLLARVRQAIVTAQARDHAVRRPACSSCGGRCHVNDWRDHLVATTFGEVTVRLPRFRCVSRGHIERCVTWPSHGRSTPERLKMNLHERNIGALPQTRLGPRGPRPHSLNRGLQRLGLCWGPGAKPLACF